MEQIARRAEGAYRIAATAHDNDTGAPIELDGPATVTIYDAYGVVVDEATPVIESGSMVYRPEARLFPLGVYQAVWTAHSGTDSFEWLTDFEIVEFIKPPSWVDGLGVTKARFAELLDAASTRVDEAIWPNAVTVATLEAYQRTVRAVVAAMDDPAVASESAGGVSLQYAEVATISAIIREGLSGTGLLYRGL